MSDREVICDCGSGLPSTWRYDARGIELCRACERCWPERRTHYRAEVLDDPDYETTEDVEED